jgi:sugar phosphate isomerase/epimerase
MARALSRRDFLAASAAAGAGAPAWASLAARAAEADPFGGWPIGIQSYTFRKFNVRDVIRHAEGMGIHFMEFYNEHYPLASTPSQIAEMKDVLARAKITANAHGVNAFSKDHAANERIFKFAQQAGIKNITADPAPDSFASLESLCAQYDIRIAIHNHGPGHRYDKLEHVAKAVEGRHKHIGACVDTGHVLRSNEDPIRWIEELGPRVFALHIKDCAEKQDRTHNVVIGRGHLDVVGLFQALKKIMFPKDGSLSLEYESNPDNPLDDVKECFAVAKEAIHKAAQA